MLRRRRRRRGEERKGETLFAVNFYPVKVNTGCKSEKVKRRRRRNECKLSRAN